MVKCGLHDAFGVMNESEVHSEADLVSVAQKSSSVARLPSLEMDAMPFRLSFQA